MRIKRRTPSRYQYKNLAEQSINSVSLQGDIVSLPELYDKSGKQIFRIELTKSDLKFLYNSVFDNE